MTASHAAVATPVGRGTVRVAVVGAAGWAGSRHVQAFSHAGARITAVSDLDPRVNEVARATGALVQTVEELRAADHDLVVVSLPTRKQPQACALLLDVGHRLLVEKPVAPTVADCAPLLDAGGTSRVMVGFTLHHHPAVQRLRNWLAGRTPVSVSARSAASKHEVSGWRADPAEGGVTSVNGVHLLELVPSLLGRRAEVVGVGGGHPFFGAGVPDHVTALLDLEGVPFTLETSWMPWSHGSWLNDGDWDVSVQVMTTTGRAAWTNNVLETWDATGHDRVDVEPLDLFAQQARAAVAFAQGAAPTVGLKAAIEATRLAAAIGERTVLR